MQHHVFECTTKLIFEPKDEKDVAGLLLYKDETHQYFLSVKKSGEDRKVSVEKISRNGIDILSEHIISGNNPLGLKVVSKGLYYDFYFTSGEGENWKELCKDVNAYYLSTESSFGFTGTTIGMYATCKNQ